MNSTSPFILVGQLNHDILRQLSKVDVVELTIKDQQAIEQLRNEIMDARLEVKDYELAETRDDQLRNAKAAKDGLHRAEQIVLLNPGNAFGAVEVAHISAYISNIRDKLR